MQKTTAIAFTYVKNEEEILPHTLIHLLSQGVDVYVIDNGSTDKTKQIVWDLQDMFGRKRVMYEYFPGKNPNIFCLVDLLRCVERAVRSVPEHDWYLLFGADEIFEAKGGVLNSLDKCRREGYNVATFAWVNFEPTDNDWQGQDPVEYFRHYSLADVTWPNQRAWMSRDFQFEGGGHLIKCPDKRVAERPAGIIRHYRFRTQEQASKKVRTIMTRYDPEEIKIGWHHQYNTVNPDASFIRDWKDLLYADEHLIDEVMEKWMSQSLQQR